MTLGSVRKLYWAGAPFDTVASRRFPTEEAIVRRYDHREAQRTRCTKLHEIEHRKYAAFSGDADYLLPFYLQRISRSTLMHGSPPGRGTATALSRVLFCPAALRSASSLRAAPATPSDNTSETRTTRSYSSYGSIQTTVANLVSGARGDGRGRRNTHVALR